MSKLLVICGPTATGKTALAIELAKKFNGEIISADSRQVYKGMDIGTGKDISEFSTNNVPVWLLDIVNPDYKFSVADYAECAHRVIHDIQKRGKLPIMVGGTGFYIKGAVDGIDTLGITPDWELRQKLSHLGVEELQEELKKIDARRLKDMNESDRNNPRRLIRAMEIAQSSNLKIPSSKLTTKQEDLLMIGLKAPYEVLYQRINKRVDERVKEGVQEEIRKLLKRGYAWKNSALGTTIGYQEWQPVFEGREQTEEIIKKWKFAEHGYARRQLTWFKADKRIKWFEISQEGWQEKLAKTAEKWYYQDKYADQS